MPEKNVIVQHKVGLHARPASVFVQTASKFSSTITVSCEGRNANAKSILNVLTLGAHQGAEITIAAEGEDAEEALSTLVGLVENNFGEGA
ncbi:MAG TPA: HPr family phosphocarrier protein [Chloroflexi bacterium]|nr:HPr family phosphocarrier protein [Chloroflexota bacterium]